MVIIVLEITVRNQKREKEKNSQRRERCFYCSILYHQLKKEDGCAITFDEKTSN